MTAQMRRSTGRIKVRRDRSQILWSESGGVFAVSTESEVYKNLQNIEKIEVSRPMHVASALRMGGCTKRTQRIHEIPRTQRTFSGLYAYFFVTTRACCTLDPPYRCCAIEPTRQDTANKYGKQATKHVPIGVYYFLLFCHTSRVCHQLHFGMPIPAPNHGI